MEDSGKLSYFFLGVGIGAAVGILFAPKTGDETRQMIKSKANEGADYVRRRGDDLRGSASTVVEKSKAAVERQREQLAAAVEAGKRAYRESVVNEGGQG